MTSPWTDEKIERLRELWLDGVSARLIGKALDVSKSAVVGKAFRIPLPRRDTPIGRPGKMAKPHNDATALATQPSLAPVPDARPESEASVPALRRSCLFIEGEKGRDFGLYQDAPRCSTPAKPGSPYCVAHHDLTHTKLQPRVAA